MNHITRTALEASVAVAGAAPLPKAAPHNPWMDGPRVRFTTFAHEDQDDCGAGAGLSPARRRHYATGSED